MAQMDGAVSYCFWDTLKKIIKNTGLQGSTLSGPRMTTGFGPFELPTRGLLQKIKPFISTVYNILPSFSDLTNSPVQYSIYVENRLLTSSSFQADRRPASFRRLW